MNELYTAYVAIIKNYQELLCTYRLIGDRSSARFFFVRIKFMRNMLSELETSM